MSLQKNILTFNWKKHFSAQIYNRAKKYLAEGRVKALTVTQNTAKELVLKGIVSGSTDYPILLSFEQYNRSFELFSHCSCPYPYECKHIAAGILYFCENQSVSSQAEVGVPEYLRYWYQHVAQKEPSDSTEKDPSFGLYFRIHPNNKAIPKLIMEPILYRHLKTGALGGEKKVSEQSTVIARHTTEEERKLLAQLKVSQKINSISYSSNDHILSGALDENNLEEILNTGKCFWQLEKIHALRLSSTISANFQWKNSTNACQKLEITHEQFNLNFFVIDRLWYYNPDTQEMGLVEHGLSKQELNTLLQMPEIRYEDRTFIKEFLNQTPFKQIPPIKELQSVHLKNIKPIPQLRLSASDYQLAYSFHNYNFNELIIAEINFDYQGTPVPASNLDPIFKQVIDENIYQVERDLATEGAQLEFITEQGFCPVPVNYKLMNNDINPKNCFYFKKDIDNEIMYIAEQILPRLKEQGWVITYTDSYPFHIRQEDSWYSTIESNASNEWFDLELGIEYEGKKINLVPVLQDFLKNLKLSDLDARENYYLSVAKNQYITIPSKRLKPMVMTLLELHQTKTNSNKLTLSRFQAGLLRELESAFDATQLRWFGEDSMLKLAHNLENFNGIQTKIPPSTFKASLRPYQQEGLNWLQFLREYELGGILADDMGLGKTIQTLAHLALEKAENRMHHPCLVIAPTSLMFNWQMEAKKFSPDLRVLCLHGKERKALFEDIHNHDLILSTYPLMIRDKSLILNHEFHMLILDEAQSIKNSKALTTQVILQIKAKHRVCLTGTPMENHLGELWSLFHFLMPGLLRDLKSFNKNYRHPIEKNGDQDKRARLIKLTKPFMLRRTKAAVAPELPEKIEMIRYVELSGPQRDFYETIRIAMNEKIQKEISRLGFAKSQIVILDALLKLRQVCCHPQLVKTQSTKKAIESAKLKELINLLQILIEEGRKILIFSAFTEMLKLIEDAIQEEGYEYLKLTGQSKNRAEIVEKFQNGEAAIFLISLKAGGVGLNLTAADTVIHYDPWWNPAAENQATDRAYRIGQDKTVMVYKLVAKDTIEDKILKMQAQKNELISNLLENKQASALSLSEDDMRDLFKGLEEQE